MNSIETLLLGLILASILGTVLILLRFSKNKSPDPSSSLALGALSENMRLLQDRLNSISESLLASSQKSSEALQKQHTMTTNIIQGVTEKLTKLDETNRQVVGFADQLQSLENILKNPKHRGVLGEYYLESVLKNVLPPASYQMQYPFENGDIVDAVVFVKDKVIPIDSKFSLENYNRIVEERDAGRREELERVFKNDLKRRIDETSKYIRPTENTMDFAFMFIPAEGIYYDLLINKVGAVQVNTHDLIEYAFSQKHVIIVSPTSFFAYLQTVLQGLRALKIEESAKEIRKQVQRLGKHLASYESYFEKVGKHLSTTVSMYNQSSRELSKIDKDIYKMTGETSVDPHEHLEIVPPETDTLDQ